MFGGLERAARQPGFTVPAQLTYDFTRSKAGASAARILRKKSHNSCASTLWQTCHLHFLLKSVPAPLSMIQTESNRVIPQRKEKSKSRGKNSASVESLEDLQ